MPPVRTQKKPINAAPQPAMATPAASPSHGIDAELCTEDGNRIGAKAEECRMAKGQKPGEADEQIEAHGEDRENEDLRHQRTRIVGQQKRQHKQHQQHGAACNPCPHRGGHAGGDHGRRNG